MNERPRRGISFYSDAQLIEELARRQRRRDREGDVPWCDECANFRPWRGDGDAPDTFNPCSKGHRLKFRDAGTYASLDFGFYRLVCEDRKTPATTGDDDVSAG